MKKNFTIFTNTHNTDTNNTPNNTPKKNTKI